MTTSKFATIHGGLLARKGEAAPAVRHPGRDDGYTDMPPREASASASTPAEEGTRNVAGLRDAGAPPAAAAAVLLARPARAPAAKPCAIDAPPEPFGADSEDGGMPQSRTTVRLTARQKHLLKVATAALGRSQQTLLSSALESYLRRLAAGELKSCHCFTRHLPRPGSGGKVSRDMN